RKVFGFCTFEYFVHINGSPAVLIRSIRSIGDQPAVINEVPEAIHGRNSSRSGERHDLLAVVPQHRIIKNTMRASTRSLAASVKARSISSGARPSDGSSAMPSCRAASSVSDKKMA